MLLISSIAIERKGVLLRGIYLPVKRWLFSLTFIWTFCHNSPELFWFAYIVQAFFHFLIFHFHTVNYTTMFWVWGDMKYSRKLYYLSISLYGIFSFIHENFCLSAKETFVSLKEASRKTLLNAKEIVFFHFHFHILFNRNRWQNWLKWNYKINSFTISFEENIFSSVGFASVKVSLIRIHSIDLIHK